MPDISCEKSSYSILSSESESDPLEEEAEPVDCI